MNRGRGRGREGCDLFISATGKSRLIIQFYLAFAYILRSHEILELYRALKK